MQEIIQWGGFHIPSINEPDSGIWMRSLREKFKLKTEPVAVQAGDAEEAAFVSQVDDMQDTNHVESPIEEEVWDSKPLLLSELSQSLGSVQVESVSKQSAVDSAGPTAGASGLADEVSSQVLHKDVQLPAPAPKRTLTKRERILTRARAVSQTPLPAKYTQTAQEKTEKDEQKWQEDEQKAEEKKQLNTSLQDRLRKLLGLGGGWP